MSEDTQKLFIILIQSLYSDHQKCAQQILAIPMGFMSLKSGSFYSRNELNNLTRNDSQDKPMEFQQPLTNSNSCYEHVSVNQILSHRFANLGIDD